MRLSSERSEKGNSYILTGALYFRIKKLAEKYPDKCEIVAINKFPGEGELFVLMFLRHGSGIQPPAVRDLTEEQKEELTNRLRGNN